MRARPWRAWTTASRTTSAGAGSPVTTTSTRSGNRPLRGRTDTTTSRRLVPYSRGTRAVPAALPRTRNLWGPSQRTSTSRAS
jgi:hypothetical protein